MSYKNVDIDNGGATAGYDPVLTVPSNTLEGDMMVVLVMTDDNDADITPTAPGGWTLEESASMPVQFGTTGSPGAIWIYSKTASAADEAGAGVDTYTWTFSGSEEQLGILILADPATWGEFAKTEDESGVKTNQDAPSVTTTVANELVFHGSIKNEGVKHTTIPSGDATVADEFIGTTVENASGSFAAFAMVREEYASIGATGTKNFACSNTANGWATFAFSLAPTSGTTDSDSLGANRGLSRGVARGTA